MSEEEGGGGRGRRGEGGGGRGREGEGGGEGGGGGRKGGRGEGVLCDVVLLLTAPEKWNMRFL